MSKNNSQQNKMKIITLILLVLAWSKCVFAGQEVQYVTEENIGQMVGTDGKPNAMMSAGAMTIVFFNDYGRPYFLGFAVTNKVGKSVVQGEYGVSQNGQPQNGGRLIFKPQAGAMAYHVFSSTNTYIYHLSYLELTTAKTDTNGYTAFVTKAIAFDNKVDIGSGTNIAFKMPKDGNLPIKNGMIEIGDSYIAPNYDLSGREVK